LSLFTRSLRQQRHNTKEAKKEEDKEKGVSPEAETGSTGAAATGGTEDPDAAEGGGTATEKDPAEATDGTGETAEETATDRGCLARRARPRRLRGRQWR
jgi:hypothetical protein